MVSVRVCVCVVGEKREHVLSYAHFCTLCASQMQAPEGSGEPRLAAADEGVVRLSLSAPHRKVPSSSLWPAFIVLASSWKI